MSICFLPAPACAAESNAVAQSQQSTVTNDDSGSQNQMASSTNVAQDHEASQTTTVPQTANQEVSTSSSADVDALNSSTAASSSSDVAAVTGSSNLDQITSNQATTAPQLTYRAHVSDIGWMDPVTKGVAGTTGRGLSLEALTVSLGSTSIAGSVQYVAHVSNVGWQDWVQDGATAGTTGQGRAIEAFKLQLTGDLAQTYDIYYRAHSAEFGWLGWAKNGEIAGSTGWSRAMQAFEICLVPHGQAAPGSTEGHYRPALYQTSFAQVGETTNVSVSPDAIDELTANGIADSVSVTARMSYGGAITREVSAGQSLASIQREGMQLDFGTYGPFTVTTEYKKNDVVVESNEQTVGVTASQYNIAPLSATLPAVMFSLSLWDITSNKAGNVPTIIMLDRPSAYDWNNLPTNTYAMPYLSETAIQGTSDYTAFADYVGDLYRLNPSASFHLYINDITCSYIQQVLYANRIPSSNYAITMLSDGSASYQFFNEAYNVADPVAKHQSMIDAWNKAKSEAYATGAVSAGYGWHEHWDSMYAVVDSETSIDWWLTRPALFTNGGSVLEQLKNDPKVKRVYLDQMLKALTAKGSTVENQFKALFNFNEGYFSQAQKQGKKIMVILGTYPDTDLASYIKLTKAYYGDDYIYYYKGHPHTPTALDPDKQKVLESLGVTDVDSSLPAELLIYFNPDMYLCGYDSSTFDSVEHDGAAGNALGLFRKTKAQAMGSTGNPVRFGIMDTFMSPISDASDAAIRGLCSDGDRCFLVEQSDAQLVTSDYTIAVYDETTDVMKYYKLVNGSYQLVKTKSSGTNLSYDAHVSNVGWQPAVHDKAIAGTTGEAKSLEAFKLSLLNHSYDGSLTYRAHVSDIGWQNWVESGEVVGTTGQSKAMEALQIKLTGEMAEHYDIYYRAHVSNVGWMDWAKNGQSAGSIGYGQSMEAVQVVLVDKGASAPGDTGNCVMEAAHYQAHVSDIGWQSPAISNEIAGTTGQSLSVEALRLGLSGQDFAGDIVYDVHASGLGWMKDTAQGTDYDHWSKDNDLAGTTGEGRQLEAIRVALTGDMAEQYDVYYRAHIEDHGWLGWTSNGDIAGSTGYGDRLEAFQVQLVPKGGTAPDTQGDAHFIKE
jgi:uncharacterized protein YjdB